MARKRKKKVDKVWLLIFIIFFLVFLLSLFKIVLWFIDNNKTAENIDEAVDNNTVEYQQADNEELIGEESDINSDYWYYITMPFINVDINELKRKNSDTVGFINVNNTNINYPFVQYTDNDYYLTHSYDKKYNEAGWVFLDYRNNKNLTDKNNIIYAHSRLDKTMFGSLSKIFKKSWYTNRDNHVIRISTETENTMWQIFSAYKIPTETYYITTNFDNDNIYQEFLDTLKNRSIYNFNVTLTPSDRILTLSTCYSEKEKTVVHAKLIKRSLR